MKNTKIKSVLAAVLLSVSGSVLAAELSPPSGYSKIQNGEGVDLYANNSKDVFVQVVDLQNGGGISFDAHAGLVDYSNKIYKKEKLDDLYNYFNSSNLFSITNGQFFDHNSSTTKLSFPVKGAWNQLATINGEVKLSKRTLYMKTDGFAYIDDGYNESLLNDYSVSDLIVSLNPDEQFSAKYAIGRFYIGGYSPNCQTNIKCKYEYLILLTAKEKTQIDMEAIADRWGVLPKSLIMLDGSGSAQVKTYKYSLYGVNNPYTNTSDKRKLPHIISIYENL